MASNVTINIRAETSQFQSAMKQAAAEMKTLTSEYTLAAAQAKLNGSASDTLRAKVTELTSKMSLQKDIISQNKTHYENLGSVLDQQKTKQEELKSKLDAARTAYEQSAAATGEDSEETKKLKAELDAAQAAFDQNEAAIQKTETALERQKAAVNNSEAALAEMEAELREVNAQLAAAPFDAYAEKAAKVGSALTGAGQAIMPVSAAVAAAGVAAVKTAADFDSSMSKVAAVSGATGDDFDALRSKALEMGNTTQFSASEAADAMNYMAMAGWKTEDMLDGISGIMNLAAASGEDLATTSDIVTDALTAFGLSASDSGHFADVLAAASSSANTNVSMLGESFKYVAPVAGAMGYSAEDVAVALGLMANSGIKASQGGTALRNVLTNLANPTDTVKSAMDRLGVSLDDGEGNMYSFREIMLQLRSGFGDLKMSQEDYDSSLQQLTDSFEAGEMTEEEFSEATLELAEAAFGAEGAMKAQAAAQLAGKNGMAGLLAIVGAEDDAFDELVGAIDDASQEFAKLADGSIVPMSEALVSGQEIIETYSGEAERMAAVMRDNLNGQITMLKGQLQTLAITFGDMLMPTIRSIVTRIQEFVDKLNNMDEGTRQTIIRVGLFVAALGPALLALGKVITFTGKVSSALGTVASALSKAGGMSGVFSKALGFIASPAGIVIAIIALITAAVITLWNTNEDFRNKVTEIWNGIKETFSNFTSGIVERLNALGFNFESITDVIKSVWEGFCNFLAPILTGAFEVIANVVETVLNGILDVVDFFTAVFRGDWEGALDAINNLWTDIWNGISNFISTVLETIKGVADVFLGWFGTSWDELWTDVSDFLTNIWNGISTFFTDTWDAIATFFTDAWDNFATAWSDFWTGVKTAVTDIWTAIKTFFTDTWDAIATFFTDAWNTFTTAWSDFWTGVQTTVTDIWTAIKTFFTDTWTSIKTTVTDAINSVKTTVTNVFTSVKTTVTNIWNNIKTATTTAWNAIKTAVTTPINAAKTAVTTAFNSIKTTVTNVWNGIKTATTNTWNAIKTAITTPINNAKAAVQNAIDAIKAKFNFSWSLPHLKMPHLSITGGFSIAPPSVPHFSISWWKTGGIMTQPTVFGALGNTLLAGGEAGDEAILPLSQFYDQLGDMLDKKLEALVSGTVVYVYVTLDGEVIATKTYSKVQNALAMELVRAR